MRDRYLFIRPILVTLALFIIVAGAQPVFAQAASPSLPYEEAANKDLDAWRELLRTGKYDELEKIGDDLRANNSKYRNGRGRLWRYTWAALTREHHTMTEEDFKRSFEWLEGWLKAHPKSINARLSMANVWEKYAFFARGGRVAPQTAEAQLQTFAERSEKASKYLDEIQEITDQVDNVYRRLRIELSKGSGEKPDVNLVYDGLKDDPRNLELVHGMAICLLPRWFGEPGELEKFADEVVRRTKKSCGQLQYVTAAVAVKEFLKSYLLDTHDFDYARLKQGFRDLERLYPESREHLDDEVHFAFMAGDLETVYANMAKLGDHPHPDSWKYTEIDLGAFRKRITPDMLAGDQKRLLLGHPQTILALNAVAGTLAVSMNWTFGVRIHEIETGKRRGWVFLEEIEAESVSIHPKAGLIIGGFRRQPGLMLYSLANGQSGGLEPSPDKIVRTTFSAKGDLMAVVDAKGMVVVIDLKTGKPSHEFPAKTPRDIRGVAFNGDATKVAASAVSGDLWVFDLEAEQQAEPRKIAFAPQSLRSVAQSDKHLAIGTSAGEVRVLDGTTFNEIAAWKSDPLEVPTLAFSPDGKQLAIGRRSENWDTIIDTPLFVWSFQIEKSPRALKGHKLGVNRVRFADDKTLLSGSHDWTIRVWDVP